MENLATKIILMYIKPIICQKALERRPGLSTSTYKMSNKSPVDSDILPASQKMAVFILGDKAKVDSLATVTSMT